jgi:hypothetical protein
MTWKRLGLNRHKANLCQLVYIAFDSAAIALQSPSDDCDRPGLALDTAENVKPTGSQQAQELGLGYE